MVACTAKIKNAKGEIRYKYQRYICGLFALYGRDDATNKTCGYHNINAARALEWLVWKIKETYLGPGRDALEEKIEAKLKGRNEPKAGDGERLQKHLAELDRQVNRLVMAIRTTDAAELAEELATVREERDTVRTAIASAKKPTLRKASETEPQQIADQLRRKSQQLTSANPALLRELLRRFVATIECRWSVRPGKHNFYQLREVRVELRATQRGATSREWVNDCPANIASGLVTFHVGTAAPEGDPANVVADLLITIWEERRGTKRKRQKQFSSFA